MHKTKIHILPRVFLSGLIVALFVVPLSVFAATGLTIQPIKISETVQPGESISGTLMLKNASDTAVDVTVSTQDFVPVSGADSIQFVGSAVGVTSVKDWIMLDSKKVFSFAVGESVLIPTIVKGVVATPRNIAIGE